MTAFYSEVLIICLVKILIQKVTQESMQGDEYAIPFLEQPLKKIYPEYSHKNLVKMLAQEQADRALGCLFGSFIGDALGAFLEFQQNIDDSLLNYAMSMPGGGTFNLRPGQVTDDSEMAFHLLKALSSYDLNRSLGEQMNDLLVRICHGYSDWKKSQPFDIGNTCRNGIKQIEKKLKNIDSQSQRYLIQLQKDVKFVNSNSESNGSLMRIAPLSFFCSLMPKATPKGKENTKEHMKLLTQKEIKLIHSNELVVESSRIWSLTLRSIIGREENNQLKDIYQGTLEYARKKGLSSWVDAVESPVPMNAVQQMGWAKIAWSYGFRFLKRAAYQSQQSELGPQLYKQCIRQVLSRGGDTDTNAAICGGMLGAIIGFKKLPKQYLKILLGLSFPNPPQMKTDRPEMYEARYAFIDAFKIIEMFTRKQVRSHVQKF